MINLRQLITENTKHVKILIKGNRGEVDQLVSFMIYVDSGTIVFLPKTSKDLDKLDLIDNEIVGDSLTNYLKKSIKLDFKWDVSHNATRAGYGFAFDYDKLLNKFN